MIEFRAASEDDLPAIQAMAESIWRSHYFPEVLSEDEIAYFLDRLYSLPALAREMEAGAEYWLLEYAGQTSGFLAYQHEPRQDRLRINKLYILPGFQRRGIGGSALNRVKDLAHGLGVEEVYLYVFRKNRAAIDAYLKQGFAIARAEYSPCDEGYAFDDYVMAYYPQPGSPPA